MEIDSDLKLIAQERAAIGAEKALMLKRLDELTADEQRLAMAEELIRALRIKHAPAVFDAPPMLVGVASVKPTLVATLGDVVDHGGAEKAQRIESLIEEALREVGAKGATSPEIFAKVTAVRDAKTDSLASTLSRMVKKNAARREGKLYFLPAQH